MKPFKCRPRLSDSKKVAASLIITGSVLRRWRLTVEHSPPDCQQSRIENIRALLPGQFSGMRLPSQVTAGLLLITLKCDWLSVHMAAATCDGKSISSVVRKAPFHWSLTVPEIEAVSSSSL